MSESKKFDPAKLQKLNNPQRLAYLSPEVIIKAIGLSNHEVLIDIGAGTGFYALHFSALLKGAKVYACDISDTMLQWMRDNIKQSEIIPTKMEESSVPLADGIADLVYTINLHHELDEPLKIMAVCKRLLRPGGKLAVIDWKDSETPEGPPIGIRVSEAQIESQMLKCGFTDIVKHAMLPYHHFVVGSTPRL